MAAQYAVTVAFAGADAGRGGGGRAGGGVPAAGVGVGRAVGRGGRGRRGVAVRATHRGFGGGQRGVRPRQPRDPPAARGRAARAGVGERGGGVDRGRHAGRELPARCGRADRAAVRGDGFSGERRGAGAGGDGVPVPHDAGAGPAPPAHDGDDRRADRAGPPAPAGGGGPARERVGEVGDPRRRAGLHRVDGPPGVRDGVEPGGGADVRVRA